MGLLVPTIDRNFLRLRYITFADFSQKPPGELILPLSFINGFLGFLSIWQSALVPSQAAITIANGIITQRGLDLIIPLTQWSQISGILNSTNVLLRQALEDDWNLQLNSTPILTETSLPYDKDPAALPRLFLNGTFAASAPKVDQYPASFCATFAAAQINALWNEDKVFVVKISDSTLGMSSLLPYRSVTGPISAQAVGQNCSFGTGGSDLVAH